jgi:hypothetical protein
LQRPCTRCRSSESARVRWRWDPAGLAVLMVILVYRCPLSWSSRPAGRSLPEGRGNSPRRPEWHCCRLWRRAVKIFRC